MMNMHSREDITQLGLREFGRPVSPRQDWPKITKNKTLFTDVWLLVSTVYLFIGGETGSLRSATAACSACMPARVLALPNLRLRSFALQNPCRRTQPASQTTKMTQICICVIFLDRDSWITTEPCVPTRARTFRRYINYFAALNRIFAACICEHSPRWSLNCLRPL